MSGSLKKKKSSDQTPRGKPKIDLSGQMARVKATRLSLHDLMLSQMKRAI